MNHLILESGEGGPIDVYPARIVPAERCFERIECARGECYPDLPLVLEETAFLAFVAFFINKYMDRSLVSIYRDIESEGDLFDYYGHNLLRCEDVSKMLEEITETAQAILNDEMTDNVKEIVLRFRPSSLFGVSASHLRSSEALGIYKKEIAQYYHEFCDAVQKVMAYAPEYDLLDFWGP